jgi:hypothetical protein
VNTQRVVRRTLLSLSHVRLPHIPGARRALLPWRIKPRCPELRNSLSLSLSGNFALILEALNAQVCSTPRWSPPPSLNGNPICNDRCYCSWKSVEAVASKNLAIFLGAASSGRSVSGEVNRLNGSDVNDRPHTVKVWQYGGRNVCSPRCRYLDVSESLCEVRYFKYFDTKRRGSEVDETNNKRRTK